ncbi:zinc ribbon domain-containing protein [Streptomyces sp. NPDC057638]|uniref:NADase-type glycan-binding domain-containing protein n=1 Tax=Streptomyces sp. NPDC057638 TaxID=3346190 RepID=UPI00369D1417
MTAGPGPGPAPVDGAARPPAGTGSAGADSPPPRVPPRPSRAPRTSPPAQRPQPAPPAQPPSPATADPVPVQPAKPIAPRPVVRAVPVAEAAGGVPCPSCGQPNRPERRFCGRCAAPLTTPGAPASLPWWRGRWARRRGPGGSGRGLRRLVAVLVLAALVIAVVLLLPTLRALVEDTRDKLGKPSRISPVSVSATASVPRHPAGDAVDGFHNRYWGAPALGDSLTFTFGSPFRLVNLVVHVGVSKKAQEFRGQARPTVADLVVTSADDRVTTKRITFGDRPGEQSVRTGFSEVVKVTLVLRSAAGLGPGRHLALAEVEFFRRT